MVLRHAEAFFWTVGIALLGFCLYTFVAARIYQSTQEHALEEAAARPAPRARTTTLPGGGGAPRIAGLDPLLIGKIEIPRIDVSSIIREGVDDETLSRAVGHIPGTPVFGERGNVALAAHRDTFFRGLKGIAKGDLINVKTPGASYEYHVIGTRIVKPDDVEVLDSNGSEELTLVTCWPFNYVGHAPKRFIVKARRVNETTARRG
jgi:sortase A